MNTFQRNDMTRSHSRSGFTLVELLTVIAVVAILAAIIFAVARKGIDTAAKAASASNLRQAHGLGSFYGVDHNGNIVPCESAEWGSSDIFGKPYQFFMEFLSENYDASYDIWRRPNDDLSNILKGGSMRERGPIGWSYARNLYLPQNRVFNPPIPSNARIDNTVPAYNVKEPAAAALFFETASSCGMDARHIAQFYFDKEGPSGECLVVYIDGHVGSVTREFITQSDGLSSSSWPPEIKAFWFGDSQAIRVQKN